MGTKIKINVNSDEDEKLFAFIGIFLPIVGFIVVLIAKNDNRYAMYYAKQGLLLGILFILFLLLGLEPTIGWIISVLGLIVILVLWIIGLIYSVSGQEKPIPFIGLLIR